MWCSPCLSVFGGTFRDSKVSLYAVCREPLDLLDPLVRTVCPACLDPLDLLDLVDALERWDLL